MEPFFLWGKFEKASSHKRVRKVVLSIADFLNTFLKALQGMKYLGLHLLIKDVLVPFYTFHFYEVLSILRESERYTKFVIRIVTRLTYHLRPNNVYIFYISSWYIGYNFRRDRARWPTLKLYPDYVWKFLGLKNTRFCIGPKEIVPPDIRYFYYCSHISDRIVRHLVRKILNGHNIHALAEKFGLTQV